jgi:hypothetical protein
MLQPTNRTTTFSFVYRSSIFKRFEQVMATSQRVSQGHIGPAIEWFKGQYEGIQNR